MEGRGTPPPRPPALWRYELWRRSHAGSPSIAKEMGSGKHILAGLGLSQRFSKAYERLPGTAEAVIYGAMGRISCCVG